MHRFSKQKICALPFAVLSLTPLLLLTNPAHAEETPTLLTIDGAKIGRIESLPATGQPRDIEDAYYQLLTPALRGNILNYRRRLIALVPDYVVAFTAADSAEITQVKSYINTVWAEIRSLHAQNFNSEVAQLLNDSYSFIFKIVDSESPMTSLQDFK